MASFEIGSLVRFRYTGARAEIIEDHMDGSYTVWLLDDEDEIVAFEEDIVLEHAFKGIETSEQQQLLAKKKPPKPPKPSMSTEELFFGKTGMPDEKTAPKTERDLTTFIPQAIIGAPPSDKGCYLAFQPTAASHYTIYLVNDTNSSFNFQYKLWLGEQVEQGFNKLIPPYTYFPIGEFWQGQFNDSPRIEFECPRYEFSKSIKLKYRKFLRTNGPVPLLGISTYHYLLFVALNPYAAKGSLKDYTQEHHAGMSSTSSLYQRADLLDVASFNPELDLHAEKLVNDTSEYSPKALFELQLQALEDFIHRASELEIEEVFIIHGLGKGKLRQAVDQYLTYHGAVASFDNNYHEKYGFGATRVRFKPT